MSELVFKPVSQPYFQGEDGGSGTAMGCSHPLVQTLGQNLCLACSSESVLEMSGGPGLHVGGLLKRLFQLASHLHTPG